MGVRPSLSGPVILKLLETSRVMIAMYKASLSASHLRCHTKVSFVSRTTLELLTLSICLAASDKAYETISS